jgi:hypothetical protein
MAGLSIMRIAASQALSLPDARSKRLWVPPVPAACLSLPILEEPTSSDFLGDLQVAFKLRISAKMVQAARRSLGAWPDYLGSSMETDRL